MTWDTFDTALIGFNAGICLSSWVDGTWYFGTWLLLLSTTFMLAVVLAVPRRKGLAQ